MAVWNLQKLHKLVKLGKATEPEQRRYRVLLKEKAMDIAYHKVYMELPKKYRK